MLRAPPYRKKCFRFLPAKAFSIARLLYPYSFVLLMNLRNTKKSILKCRFACNPASGPLEAMPHCASAHCDGWHWPQKKADGIGGPSAH